MTRDSELLDALAAELRYRGGLSLISDASGVTIRTERTKVSSTDLRSALRAIRGHYIEVSPLEAQSVFAVPSSDSGPSSDGPAFLDCPVVAGEDE